MNSSFAPAILYQQRKMSMLNLEYHHSTEIIIFVFINCQFCKWTSVYIEKVTLRIRVAAHCSFLLFLPKKTWFVAAESIKYILKECMKVGLEPLSLSGWKTDKMWQSISQKYLKRGLYGNI